MVTKKKKKYQLKYSLMLLLQKQYKLRLNFKVMKFTLDYYRIFYPKKKKKILLGSTIQHKGIEPFFKLKQNVLLKKLFKNTLNPSFFFSGSFIWNILLNSLKTSSFLLTEKNLRSFNLNQDEDTLLIKNFVLFLFQKNQGHLLFQILNKKQIRQRLFVQFLMQQNDVNINTFAADNQDLYTTKIGSYIIDKEKLEFFIPHVTFCPTWEKNWSANLKKGVQEIEDPSEEDIILSLFTYDTFILPADYDIDDSYNDEDLESSIPGFNDDFSDEMDLTYTMSDYDSGDYPDDYIPDGAEDYYYQKKEDKILDLELYEYTEEEELEFSIFFERDRIVEYMYEQWPYIPKFLFSDFSKSLFENVNHTVPDATDYIFEEYETENLFDSADYHLNIIEDTFFGIDLINENFGEPYQPTLEPEFHGFTIDSYSDVDLFQNNILDKLQLVDSKEYFIDTESVVNWRWKTLLTYSNFQNINFFENDFNLLKFSKLKKKLRKKTQYKLKNFRLFTKNFYLSPKLLQQIYKKSNYQTLNTLVFDPIPFTFVETTILQENNYIEQLFSLRTNVQSIENVFVEKNENQKFIPFNISLDNQLTHIRGEDLGPRETGMDTMSTLSTINLVQLTNKNDFYPQLQVLDFNNINKTTVNENTFEFLQDLTLLNSTTWMNWSVSFYELFTYKINFFSHPFLNQYHQILYKFFFKQLLINYIYLNNVNVRKNKFFVNFTKFWTFGTTRMLLNEIKHDVIIDLFLEKVDFSEDFLTKRFSRLNLFDYHELQATYPLFFLEKAISTSETLEHYSMQNVRKFWENSTELYDYAFLHFSDARWQDYIPLIKAPKVPAVPWWNDIEFLGKTDTVIEHLKQTKYGKSVLPKNIGQFWPRTMDNIDNTFLPYVEFNKERRFDTEVYNTSPILLNEAEKKKFNEVPRYFQYRPTEKDLFWGFDPNMWRDFFSDEARFKEFLKAQDNSKVFYSYENKLVQSYTKLKKYRLTNRGNELPSSFSLKASYYEAFTHPEIFQYRAQPSRISLHKYQQLVQEHTIQKKLDFQTLCMNSDFLFCLEDRPLSYISPLWLHPNVPEVRQNFFNNFLKEHVIDETTVSLPESSGIINNTNSFHFNKIIFDRFLQRYVPTGYFYSNFLLFLNQRNKLSISNWLKTDAEYFTFLIFFNLISTKNFNFQELNLNYLLLKKLSSKTLFSLLFERTKNNNLFDNLKFLRALLFKFQTTKDLQDFIHLLQVALYDRDKTDYNLSNFLNKLYFFFDLIKMFEEPLTEFWYSLFTAYELGEYSTQNQLIKINTNQIRIDNSFNFPKYRSLNLLLWSFFSKEEKSTLLGLVNYNNVENAQIKKQEVKNLNKNLIPMFLFFNHFTSLTLLSTLQSLRSFDKQIIDLFYNNLNFNTKKNIFYHIFLLDKYKMKQVDFFCYNQSFLASHIYQTEQLLMRSNYNLWLLSFFFRCLFLGIVIYFFVTQFFVTFGFTFLSLIFFFSARYCINKAMLNNFTSYCYSILEINKYNHLIKNPKLGIMSRIFEYNIDKIDELIKQDVTVEMDVSPYYAVMDNPFKYLQKFFILEYRLYEHYANTCLESAVGNTNSYQTLQSYKDFHNKYPSHNYYSDLPQFVVDQLRHKTLVENNDYILPISQSVSSLEHFAFNEVDTAKQMVLYWGMPLFGDKANRNPLFYVLQLSEDYKFFRLFKSKFIYKWFFF